MIDIPLGLRDAIESGNCVLFLGAGIGTNLTDPQGKPAPDGKTLSRELAENFKIDARDKENLKKISELVEKRHGGRSTLETFLKNRLSKLMPDATLQWISSRVWKAIYTTNYDDGLEKAYQKNETPKQNPVIFSLTSDLVHIDGRFDVPLIHLHGTLFNTPAPCLIITENDYIAFRDKRRSLFEMLKIDFATSTFLFIGYSNEDDDWNIVYHEITSELYPTKLPVSYRVVVDPAPEDIELLKSKSIETINTTFQDFVNSAAAQLNEGQNRAELINRLRPNIPPGLTEAFDSNPQAVIRFLTSWEYVNYANFREAPNLTDFLNGDRPNWALVGAGKYFERDIEESAYNELLDYVTGNNKTPLVNLYLGSAGYGVTTLLMSLASKLIKDHAGDVFALKPGKFVQEGDILFAASIFKNKPIFVIDNAAENASIIYSAIHRLKETGRVAMLILGERINEWRQCGIKPRGKEFVIEPLSDPEINRLLDYLTDNNALNQLEHLARDMQFSVVKKNYNKELLIAMREATEGKSFDAILENEFRGIGDPFSQRIYLFVCCFYQHGAFIRDSLLAELLSINVVELNDYINKYLEGVVSFECTDEENGRYIARTRHRIIANIVWDRCGEITDKENMLQQSLDSLNLNYPMDKEAFDQFVRSDRVVDQIRTLDGRIKFFDLACRKDPLGPYVRQHFARMFLRFGNPSLALAKINEGIELDSKGKVLYNTKGIATMQLAIENESHEVALKWLAQSEECFRIGKTKDPKDEYNYQGLAQLYLNWAKRRDTSIEESAEYITKAENQIEEGLKCVRQRDGLWLEFAKIQNYLKDEPSRVIAIENALKINPNNTIARFLLGRMYRKRGEYEKAMELISPIIQSGTSEQYRSFLEYALACLFLKKDYREPIAILRICQLYGFNDPKFIATLGGMLFMNKDFEAADEVFKESTKRNFTWPDLTTVFFRPLNLQNPDDPLAVVGKVVAVKAGYSWIASPEYPSFFCPSSKYKGLLLEPQMAVSFEPAFTPKGSIANRPQAI